MASPVTETDTASECCCFCFRIYDISTVNYKTFLPENQQFIHSTCSSHINPEHLSERFVQWSHPMPLPFCKRCLVSAEKLARIYEHLINLQRKFDKFVTKFTGDFITRRPCTNESYSGVSDSLETDDPVRIKQEQEDDSNSYLEESGAEDDSFLQGDHEPFSESDEIVEKKPDLANLSRDEKFIKRKKAAKRCQYIAKKNSGASSQRKKQIAPNTSRHRNSGKLRRTAALKAEEKFSSWTEEIHSPDVDAGYDDDDLSGQFSGSDTEDTPAGQSNQSISKSKMCKTRDDNFGDGEDDPDSSFYKGRKYECKLCSKSYMRKDHLQAHERTHDEQQRYRCTLCDISYAYIKNLRIHMRKHESGKIKSRPKKDKSNETTVANVDPEKPFKCSQCDKNYKTKSSLQEHERTHFLEKRFKCSLCDMSFSYMRSMREHYRKRHNTVYSTKGDLSNLEDFATDTAKDISDPTYQSDNEYSTSEKDAAEDEYSTSSKEKPRKYECKLCDKSYLRIRHLRDHELTHDEEKRFKCDKCDTSYAYMKNLRHHLKQHESGKIFPGKTESSRGEGSRPFKCNHCEKNYKTKFSLQEHERTHFKKFQCSLCDMSFFYLKSMRDHYRKRHRKIYSTRKGYVDCEGEEPSSKDSTKEPKIREKRPKSGIAKTFVCKECGKECSSYGSLFYHRKSHITSVAKCNICNKVFKNIATLSKHKLIHSEISSRFLCHVCGKEFKSANGKREHEKYMHREEGDQNPVRQKYQCPICGKIYCSRGGLSLHSWSHTGVKKHECQEPNCGKAFYTNSKLEIHMLHHRKERPFLCDECGMSFFTKAKLKIHNRIHTGMLFRCEYCEKGFQTTTHLKQHYRSHNKDIMQSTTTESYGKLLF